MVHDEAADGREAWGRGAPTDEVVSIEIALEQPSVFAEARRSLAPQIRRLDATETDREVARALRRASTPTAMVMPIAIRQRVVILLYGDRDGEVFDLGAVMELVRFGSRVVEAFELLILRRKRVGYHVEPEEVAERGSLKEAARTMAETAGSARPGAPAHDDGGWKPGRRRSAVTLPAMPSDEDSWASVAAEPGPGAVPGQATPRAMEPVDTPADHPEAVAESAVAETVLAELPSHAPDAPPQSILGIPRSAPPPPPSMELDLGAPELAALLAPPEEDEEPELIVDAAGDEDDDLDGLDGLDDLDGYDDEDHDDLDDQDDDDQDDDDQDDDDQDDDDQDDDDQDDDDQDDHDHDHDDGDHDDDDDDHGDHEEPAPGPREPVRPRVEGTYRLHDAPVDVVRPAGAQEASRRTSNRSRSRSPRDPRREDDEDGAPAPEVIQAPSSRPPPRGMDADTRSVIVDMGEQVHAQVEDLLRERDPSTRDRLIHGLLYLGEAALPTLIQAFPGPLQHERSRASGPPPAGRDVSVIARALVAFGERAVPYVASLLGSGHADVRYYAALVASELVHPDLTDAVAERVYDTDGQVRKLACALLPRFAGYRAFDEVRVVLRRTARLRGKDPSRRRHAVDALVSLRDVAMLDKLIELLKEDDAALIDHVHRALVILTCTDLGRSYRRWKSWLAKHGGEHRIEWLVEGLLHGDEKIRALAGAELERLTQESYGFHAGSPKKERERIHRLYRRWWDEVGHRRFA